MVDVVLVALLLFVLDFIGDLVICVFILVRVCFVFFYLGVLVCLDFLVDFEFLLFLLLLFGVVV